MSDNEPTSVKEYERRNGEAIYDVQKLNWTVILFLVLQTTGAIWWAATTHSTLSFVQQSLVELKADLRLATTNRYTTSDAEKDKQYLDARIDALKSRVVSIEAVVFKNGPSR